MILFDELQDLAMSRIIGLVRGIIVWHAMIEQHLCCLSQRCIETVRVGLTLICRGVIGKVLHGVVLCHENILIVGIPAQSLQPIVLAFIHRGDGPTTHAREKTLQLLFQEKQKVVVPPTILALVDYHKPKHPSLILEMVDAYNINNKISLLI